MESRLLIAAPGAQESLTKSKSFCCWEYLLLGIREEEQKSFLFSYGDGLEQGRIHYPAGWKVLVWFGQAVGNFIVFSKTLFPEENKFEINTVVGLPCHIHVGWGLGLYSTGCTIIHLKKTFFGGGGVEEKFARIKLNVFFFSEQTLTCFCHCFGVSFFSNVSKKAHCVLSTAWIICYKESILALLSYLPLRSSWMRKREWEWQREECLVKNIEHFYR